MSSGGALGLAARCAEQSDSDDDESLRAHFDVCARSCSNHDDSTPCLACNECKARQNRIDELETQVAELKRQKTAWEHDELNMTKQLNVLYAGENTRLHSWRGQIDRMSEYERKIIRLEGDLQLAEHNNKVLRQSLEKHKDVSKALNDARKDVGELQGRLPKQFDELREARDRYSNEARDLYAECWKLQEENGNQSREIAHLKRQVEEWKYLVSQQPSDGVDLESGLVMGYQSGQNVIKKRGLPASFATAKSSGQVSAQKKKK